MASLMRFLGYGWVFEKAAGWVTFWMDRSHSYQVELNCAGSTKATAGSTPE